MTGPKKNRGEMTREAILQAAEAAFAEQGFAGARVDAIAEAAGCNKALIFRYFKDKLGLYAAVLERSDAEMSRLLLRLFSPLLEDESIAADPRKFRGFLAATFTALFDYMLDHPRFTRILNWEQAEGWQAFSQVAGRFQASDLPRFEALFSKARAAGLLRPGVDVFLTLLLAMQMCWSAPAAVPLYQSLLANETSPSPADRAAAPSPTSSAGSGAANAAARAHLRDQLIPFLISSLVRDPTGPPP